MSVFGIVQELHALEGTVTFIGVVVFIVALDLFFEELGVFCSRHGYASIYEKLKKELTILGIISFALFLYLEIAGHANLAILHSFDFAHIVVLFLAFAFILQAVLLVTYAYIGGQKILGALRTPISDLIEIGDNLNKNPKSLNYRAFHLPHWLPIALFPGFRDSIEYKIIEKFFLGVHPVPEGFRFSKYATILFTAFVSEIGEVGPVGWTVIALLVLVNFARITLVDSRWKSLICDSHAEEASSEHHRYLNEREHSYIKGCTDYTLAYGLFCGFCLLALTFIVFLVSSYYYDKMVKTILKYDKIDTDKPGKECYFDFLKRADEKEKVDKKASMERFASFSVNGGDKSPKNHSSRAASRSRVAQSQNKDAPSIQQYKDDMDYKKLKADHERELALSIPLYDRIYNYFFKPQMNMAFTPNEESFDEIVVVNSSSDEQVNSPNPHQIIESIFFLRSLDLLVVTVQITLILQCFYVSLLSTQLLPLAEHLVKINETLFIVLSVSIMCLNSLMFASIIHSTVMLRCAVGLHEGVVGKVCDQILSENSIINNMRRVIIESLHSKNPDKKYWRGYVKKVFDQFDLSKDGTMNSAEFRNFLGALNIYMAKERFDLVWESVDYDQSGSITWDELFIIVFPELKYEIKEQVALLDDLRKKLTANLKQKNIKPSQRVSYLQGEFNRIDEDNSGFIEFSEFRQLLIGLNMTDYTDEQIRHMFVAADTEAEEKLKFPQFTAILNLNVSDEYEAMFSNETPVSVKV